MLKTVAWRSFLINFDVFGTNFGQLESLNSELGGAPGPGGVTLGIWAWEVNNLG